MLIGLIPMLVVVLQGSNAMIQMQEYALTSSLNAMKTMGIQGIKNTAVDKASQILDYLDSHPEFDPENAGVLKDTPDLLILVGQPIGKSGYSMLFNEDLIVLYHPDPKMIGTHLSAMRQVSSGLWHYISISLSNPRSDGEYEWPEADGRNVSKYISIVQVGDTPLRIAAIVDSDELTSPFIPVKTEFESKAGNLRVFHTVVGIVVGVLTLTAAVVIGTEVTGSLVQMAADARRMIRDIENPIPVAAKSNELEILHNALTNVFKQVREVRTNLEKQVKLRTADLARRNAQVEAVIQVAHEAVDVLDVKQMLTRTTQLISESFAFYHTGIFLIDDAEEYAILQATNSDGGQRMLARGHKINLGEGGVVDYVATNREPYIVADTYIDNLHVNNPDLPRTRSELALPLKVHGKVIGVLDVQSTEPSAYNQDDVKILSILSDQVALAIQNARLLEESQRMLRELYHTYGEDIRQSWRQRVGQKPLAYAYNRIGVEPASPVELDRDAIQKGAILTKEEMHKLIVPIEMRGQSLGSILLTREKDRGSWSNQDLMFMQEVAEQIGPALENARLLEEIQRRALLERQIGHISAKAQGSLDMETVIKTAIQEIGLAIDATRVQIRLESPGKTDLPSGNGGGGDNQ